MVKKAISIDEGVPAGQRFPISCPYELSDPVGVTSYTEDYPEKANVQREPVIRPHTSRANRPHTHPQFPHLPRQPNSVPTGMSEEIRQALRNQFKTTYGTDYLGK